ncbi:protein THEMIS2 isoform X2 [Mixophyes fleayi]|uniref:protein THEMIS2 isoform X2 n=1 Tax=Mixophyes fleayi TaxID=3061075 RepID=UPI003F4DCE7E
MEDLENAVPLKDCIASLPVSSLPRILQIASGVYLQSSVYDIQGSECCLSTGDLLKVVAKELQSVSFVNLKTGKSQNLPNGFQGVFQISVHNCVYNTLRTLHEQLSYDNYMLPYWFMSKSDFIVGDQVLSQLLPIRLMSVDRYTCCAECQVFHGQESYSITIPLSTNGEFYECENDESYTLEQVLQSPVLLKRNFKCRSIGTGMYSLQPEYEIKTIMHMRKGFVKMPSSLEVDVIDITGQCGNITFVQPLSLTEVCESEDKFPVVAEILDREESSHLLKNDTYLALHKGQKIIIYKKIISTKVLAAGTKGKTSRFFYIHNLYQGKFRQRPREFSTIYEIWTRMMEEGKLTVVVNQDSESFDDNFPSLCIGDHLQILRHTRTQMGTEEVDVLVCIKESTEDDDEDEPQEIMLPFYMEGRFVEEVKDNKKYSISNIIQKLKLPCEVKVVTRDKELATDPLASFGSLRLEEVIEEPVLRVCLFDNVSECYELPIKYFNISMVLLEDHVPSVEGMITSIKVEELVEWFYYSLLKSLPCNHLPPPRPPKRQIKTKEEKPCNKPEKSKNPAPLKKPTDSIYAPSRPCKGSCNMYSSTPKKSTVTDEDNDSDHDYEQIKEEMKNKLKIMN